jgi:hypothetical protein
MSIKKYNNISFDDCGEPVSLDDIRSFQEQHRVILPDDYVDFLCVVNGGIPTPSFFSSSFLDEESGSEEIEEFEVRELFGLRSTGYTERIYLEKLCINLVFPNVPDSRSFLMIGDVDANRLYIATCKKYFGNIFCGSYSFGRESDDELIAKFGVDLDDELFHIYEEDIVASSFSSFLSLLR